MNLSRKNISILGAVIFILVAAIVIIPKYQSAIYLSKVVPDLTSLEAKDRVAAIRDVELYENSARTTLAQIVGGLVILLGLYFTYLNSRIAQDNLRITEEGKLTDRFSKAVEMLGSEKLDVRLGGIYALERIARDSKKDHWTVMEVLTAFVRENSYIKLEGQKDNKPREDIQAVMTVIGRRKWTKTESENQRLNLKRVNLLGCVLFDSNLVGAELSGSNLSFAVLDRANLQGAYLSSANIEKASLCSTNLKYAFFNHANLSYTSLEKADLSSAKMLDSNLTFASFRLANLQDTDLRAANNLTLEQILMAETYSEKFLPTDLIIALQEWRLIDAEDNASADADKNRANE